MADILEFLKLRWRLIALLTVVLALAVVCVLMYRDYLKPTPSGAYLDKTLKLKCTNCGHVARHSLGEIRSMVSRPEDLGSPIVVNCPQCGQKTLTQEYACPNCGEFFIINLGQSGTYNCPRCRTNYFETLPQKSAQDTPSK